jgi:sugar diacid utilization regulator
MDAATTDPASSGQAGAPAGRSRSERHVDAIARICQCLKPGMSFREVLQAVVDALGDHTDWGLCFIYVMDADSEIGEVAARRDRIEYSADQPFKRWESGGTPALTAIRRNDIVAVPDASSASHYPRLMESASRLGVVSAVYLPLDMNDSVGRPMLLCVQSRKALLNDASQIPFLRAIASIASMAAASARAVDESKAEATTESAYAAVLTSTTAGVTHGEPTRELLSAIEHRTNQPLIVYDQNGKLVYSGRSPLANLSEDGWYTIVQSYGDRILDAAEQSFTRESSRQAVAIEIGSDDLREEIRGLATSLGSGDAHSAIVITFPLAEASIQSHVSASTAAAIVLLRDRLTFESQSRLKHDALIKLLNGDFTDEFEMTTMGSYAGIDFSKESTLIVVKALDDRSYVRVNSVMQAQVHNWTDALLGYAEECFVALLPDSPGSDAMERVARTIERQLTTPSGECEVMITISEACGIPRSYSTAWNHCMQTVDNAQVIDRRGVIRSEDFGAFRLLLPGLESGEMGEFILETIGPLLEHDEKHGSELFITAEAFASLGGRFESTARQLFIHVSTLRYRLKRIEELLGHPLTDDEVRFEIQLAARLERLRRGRSDPEMRRDILPDQLAVD